jgi:hypothetical protein
MALYVHTGLGTQWIRQDGSLDGISQNVWVPFYRYGGGFNLFEQKDRAMGLTGVSVGVTAFGDLSAKHKVSGMSFDLGSGFYL